MPIWLGVILSVVTLIVGLVGVNFLFELIINIVLSPSVVGAVRVLSKRKH